MPDSLHTRAYKYRITIGGKWSESDTIGDIGVKATWDLQLGSDRG
jgi:hypothetical protein